MRPIRFSIASMLIAVLFVGFGFAAFREANDTWDSSTFSITLAVLLISILLAVHRSEKKRAYWLGFALFGSAYLALSFVPSIESRLITTRALTFLDSKMLKSIPSPFAGFDLIVQDSQPYVFYLNNRNSPRYDVTAVTGSNPAGNPAWSLLKRLLGSSLTRSSGTTENFVRIGHSLIAVIVGSLGGYISRRLYANNREAVEESVIPQGSTSSDRSRS